MSLIPIRSRRFGRVAVLGGLLAVMATSAAVSQTAASGGDSVEFRIRDNCEVESFNLVVGPDTCVGDGTTTFDEAVVAQTLGTVLKYREDQGRVQEHGLDAIVSAALDRGSLRG